MAINSQNLLPSTSSSRPPPPKSSKTSPNSATSGDRVFKHMPRRVWLVGCEAHQLGRPQEFVFLNTLSWFTHTNIPHNTVLFIIKVMVTSYTQTFHQVGNGQSGRKCYRLPLGKSSPVRMLPEQARPTSAVRSPAGVGWEDGPVGSSRGPLRSQPVASADRQALASAAE